VERVLWVVVGALWLLTAVRVAQARRRGRGDRRLLTALDTLRAWEVPPDVRIPQQRTTDSVTLQSCQSDRAL